MEKYIKVIVRGYQCMWRRGRYNAINGVKQHPGIIFMIYHQKRVPRVSVCVSMSGSGACWALAAVGQGHGGWGYPSLFFPAWCWCPSPVCWYLLVPEQVAECSGILEWLTQFGWVGAVTRFRLSLTLLVLVDWAGYWLHVQMGPQIWGMSAHVRILFIVASAVWQPLVQRW